MLRAGENWESRGAGRDTGGESESLAREGRPSTSTHEREIEVVDVGVGEGTRRRNGVRGARPSPETGRRRRSRCLSPAWPRLLLALLRLRADGERVRSRSADCLANAVGDFPLLGRAPVISTREKVEITGAGSCRVSFVISETTESANNAAFAPLLCAKGLEAATMR